MKLIDVLNTNIEDIVKMSKKELSKLVQTGSAVANKRIARLNKSDVMSASKKKYGNKHFSTKGKNINQLRNEFKILQHFLSNKSSTVTGSKQIQKEIEKRLGGKLTKENADKFWTLYNRITEERPNIIKEYGSDRLQQLLYNNKELINLDSSAVMEKINDELSDYYENDLMSENDISMDDFFNIDPF